MLFPSSVLLMGWLVWPHGSVVLGESLVREIWTPGEEWKMQVVGR
jgi:hypothetical protein